MTELTPVPTEAELKAAANELRAVFDALIAKLNECADLGLEAEASLDRMFRRGQTPGYTGSIRIVRVI